jgi:plastocyanin
METKSIPFLLSAALLLAMTAIAAPLANAGVIEGMVLVRGARDNRDAVIYIDRIPGRTFHAPAKPIVLDQRNLTFDPHVLPVLAGSRIAFPNSDEIRHNVFSPTSASKFNLGTYPRGTTMYHVFNQPGPVTLLCNVHAEMSAYVFVAETPWFAVSDRTGKFVIPDVPPGKYVLKTWHEKAKPASIEIEVTGNGVTTVNIELKK